MATEWSFGCLAAYLAFSGIVLATGGHYGLALLHAAGVIAGLAVVRLPPNAQRPTPRAQRFDIIPLFIWPFLYFELPAIIATIGSSYHDQSVQRLELALFHTQPSQTLAGLLPWRPLSELLHAGYLAYYPAIFLPPARLLFHEDRRALSQTMLAIACTYAICWIVYAFFPVEGPRYLWPAPPHIPDGPIRRVTVGILAGGSSRGAAFPSSHTAVATVQAILATRWQRDWSYALWLIAAMIGIGAVYAGFHYAADILAGAFIAAVIGATILKTFPTPARRTLQTPRETELR